MQLDRKHTSFWVRLAEGFPIAGISLLVGCQTYALMSGQLRLALLFLGVSLLAIYCLLHLKVVLADAVFVGAWLAFTAGSEFFNVLNSADPLDTRAAVFRIICYILLLCGIVVGARFSRNDMMPLTSLGRLPIVISWLLVAVGVMVYLRDIQSMMALVSAQRFAGSEDLHPVGIAYGYGCCLVIVGAFFTFDRSWVFRVMCLIMIGPLVQGIISTGSRGALVGALIAIIILEVCMLKRASNRKRFFYLMGWLLIGVILFVSLSANELTREQIRFLYARFSGLDSGVDPSSLERFALWQHYSDQFYSWFLLGLSGYAGAYPHNFFYEFWLRFGLIGLGFSIASTWAIIQSVVLLWRYEVPSVVCGIIGVLLFSFINAQFNLALDFNRGYWLGLGCVFVLWSVKRSRGSRSAFRNIS